MNIDDKIVRISDGAAMVVQAITRDGIIAEHPDGTTVLGSPEAFRLANPAAAHFQIAYVFEGNGTGGQVVRTVQAATNDPASLMSSLVSLVDSFLVREDEFSGYTTLNSITLTRLNEDGTVYVSAKPMASHSNMKGI